ncbi:MAG: Rpn family recombination-promoting nuclease/putative transposase [Blastocatellia bacterium]
MKRTPPRSPDKPARGASDNLCKRLAEEYPDQFAQWLFGAGGKVKVDKTELSREPVRADSVIFSRDENETLHAEFQTTMKSNVPVPLRMLDYYVGLKRRNPKRRVRQVLVVLKPTGEEIPDRYEDERTVHIFDVVKVWMLNPAVLLQHEGLLPLATLCQTESGEKLLKDVAARINRIKSPEQRRETLNWSRVLAGLRYNKGLVYKTLKESDMLEESVVYQDILQKGRQRGLQEGERKGERRGLRKGIKQGLEQGEKKVALSLLALKVGKLPLKLRRQVEQLALPQIEALCVALLNFKTKEDLIRWLKKNAPATS